MKKKPKVKILTLKINPKDYRKGAHRYLTFTQCMQLETALKRGIKDTNVHFRKKGHGWNLSWACIEEGILNEVFGHHLTTYILARYLKGTGATWGTATNGRGYEETMLVKPRRRVADKRRKTRPNKRVRK